MNSSGKPFRKMGTDQCFLTPRTRNSGLMIFVVCILWRRPEIFALLGFTHSCRRTRGGRFIVKRKTEGKRLTRKLTALRQDPWRLMHESLATQHEWFAAVPRGHLRLLRQAERLPSAQRLLPGSASDVDALSGTAQPEKSAHGLVGVRDPDGRLSSVRFTHDSHLAQTRI